MSTTRNPIPPPTQPMRPVSPSATVFGRSDLDANFNNYAESKSGGSRSGGGGGGSQLVPYPSVFKDLSNLDIPSDLKELFKVCRYLSQWSPVHKAFVGLMSTLPVTDIVIKSAMPTSDVLKEIGKPSLGTETTSDAASVRRIAELATVHWNLKKVNQQIARAYWTYTNAVTVISYPFRKMLRCTKCGETRAAIDSVWTLEPGGKFRWKCTRDKCGHEGPAAVADVFRTIPEEVKLLVLDLEQIDAIRNDFRGTVDLYYTVPDATIDRLKSSPCDKSFVCDTPQAYLEAALGKLYYPGFTDGLSRVKLMPEQCFLLQSASLPQGIQGLAFPEMVATLKDYWLARLEQKSQEAIVSEMAVPKRYLFPESSNAGQSLFELVSVSSYMNVLKGEYAKQRTDPGYVGVVPFPVGQTTLGGEAKPLALAAELKVQMEMQTAGLGIPIEAVFGGLQFSGASVSLQQVIAKFQDFRSDLLAMNRWFVSEIAKHMSLPAVVIEHKPFRMGEDTQYLQMLSGLVGGNQVSLRRLHDAMSIDSDSERLQILEDQRFMAEIAAVRAKSDAAGQGQLALKQMAAQAEGQVAGTEAQLNARVELAETVRGDEKLFNLVKADPMLLGQIFGPNSPEAFAVMGGPAGTGMPAPLDNSSQPPAPTDEAGLREYISGFGEDTSTVEEGEAAAKEEPPSYQPSGA